jgi:hypothetical protein
MKRKGIVQSLVLAGILAAGFLAVWGLVAFWALEVAAYVTVGIDSQTVIFPLAEILLFLPDGTPVVGSHQVGQRQHFRDLQGHPVAEPDGEHPFLKLTSLPAKYNVEEGTDDWEQRIHSFADGRVPAGYWYFITDGRYDGRGYFVGYDSESHSCLGYLGVAGLRDQPPSIEECISFAGGVFLPKGRLLCTQQLDHPTHPAEIPQRRSAGRAPHGSVSTWDVYVLGGDARLYHVDLQQRVIQVAFDRSPVVSAALTAGQPDAIHGTPYRLAVRTEDAVLVLDARGGVLKRYPIPESLRGHEINFGETNAGEAVMYTNSPQDILASEVEYRICRVDSTGRCWQATTVLPFLGYGRAIPLAGLVIPSPLVLAGTVAYGRSAMLREEELAATYPEALGRALTEFWLALVVSQLLACGLAVLCYRRQVKYGASRTERIVWTLFVLLLGLPGWIGYRFGRSWTVLEACPECFATAPRDRENCFRCTNDFPHPARKGTEVFA